jgi:hypothetical protein
VLLFLRWLDGALDATRLLREHAPDPPGELLAGIAAALVDAARRGLVHGRHATGNLMALPEPGGGWRYQVIDFAQARLAPGLDARGFVRDAVRFAAGMCLHAGCSRPSAHALLEQVARLTWPDAADAARGRAQLERGLARSLAS